MIREGRCHRVSPLTRRRLLEFGAAIEVASFPKLFGMMFSSLLGDVRRDWRGGLLEVVRGRRLFAALPEPFAIGIELPPFPSRLVGLNGIGPPMA